MVRNAAPQVLLLAGLAVGAATPAQAADFVVTTTTDSGAGSLRQAMLDAEANAVADTIAFDIGGCAGTPPLCTIRLLSPLPAITRNAIESTVTRSPAQAPTRSESATTRGC